MTQNLLRIITGSLLILVPTFAMNVLSAQENNLQASILELDDGEIRVELWNETSVAIPVGEDRVLKVERRNGKISVWQTTAEQADSPTKDLPTPLHDKEIDTFDDRAAEIRMLDANFDGKTDLLVETGIGYGGVNVFFDLYLRGIEELDGSKLIKGLVNPEFDAELKQIHSSSRSGPQWSYSVYEMEKNAPYRRSVTTNVGDGVEYSKILLPSGELERELITYALTDDPNEWQPISIKLPDETVTMLHSGPTKDSSTISLQGGSLFLRRMSSDREYIFVEHIPSLQTGWIKRIELPQTKNLVLY